MKDLRVSDQGVYRFKGLRLEGSGFGGLGFGVQYGVFLLNPKPETRASSTSLS